MFQWVRVVVLENCGAGELRCVGVALHGSCGVWELRNEWVPWFGSCRVWELRGLRVAVCEVSWCFWVVLLAGCIVSGLWSEGVAVLGCCSTQLQFGQVAVWGSFGNDDQILINAVQMADS